MATIAERIKEALKLRNMIQADLVAKTKIGKSSISTYISGEYEPKQKNIYKIAEALNVSEAWLLGHDVPMERNASIPLNQPTITSDTVSFPVIGEVAAGYDEVAVENWSGDTIEIPISFLKGREPSEFFVLSVIGDSMYPLYHDGDKVLVKRQSTLNCSGEVGVIIYENELATLKKIEYVPGEDWLKLIPINPEFKPKTIKDADLDQCRVLGVPVLLIREF